MKLGEIQWQHRQQYRNTECAFSLYSTYVERTVNSFHCLCCTAPGNSRQRPLLFGTTLLAKTNYKNLYHFNTWKSGLLLIYLLKQYFICQIQYGWYRWWVGKQGNDTNSLGAVETGNSYELRETLQITQICNINDDKTRWFPHKEKRNK